MTHAFGALRLNDRDLVLFDRSQRTIREDAAIWVLTIGEVGMIKRLRLRGKKVDIMSDNDRIETYSVHADEVNIIGRIVFVGKRY